MKINNNEIGGIEIKDVDGTLIAFINDEDVIIHTSYQIIYRDANGKNITDKIQKLTNEKITLNEINKTKEDKNESK